MKKIIERIAKYLNFIGLLSIILYFLYVGVSLYRGSGNYFVNIALLISTVIYLILYIYSVYVEENKKIKKVSKKLFKKSKKILGLVNACLVFFNLFGNSNNSFLTIILAVVTLGWQMFYVTIDLLATFAIYKVKKNIKGLRNRYDHRS